MKLATKPATKKVKAAGGVVWRRRHGTLEVLLVHRPRYRDWSFPKGKLEDGEKYRVGARREVEEETGYLVELGSELSTVRYHDSCGRPKKVRYWAMTVIAGSFVENDEVDRARWCSIPEATRLLTYAHDAEVLESFCALMAL